MYPNTENKHNQTLTQQRHLTMLRYRYANGRMLNVHVTLFTAAHARYFLCIIKKNTVVEYDVQVVSMYFAFAWIL